MLLEVSPDERAGATQESFDDDKWYRGIGGHVDLVDSMDERD